MVVSWFYSQRKIFLGPRIDLGSHILNPSLFILQCIICNEIKSIFKLVALYILL